MRFRRLLKFLELTVWMEILAKCKKVCDTWLSVWNTTISWIVKVQSHPEGLSSYSTVRLFWGIKGYQQWRKTHTELISHKNIIFIYYMQPDTVVHDSVKNNVEITQQQPSVILICKVQHCQGWDCNFCWWDSYFYQIGSPGLLILKSQRDL